MGIAAIVGLASIQVITLLLQGSSTLRSKLGHVSMQKDLQQALRRKNSCLASLQNQGFTRGTRNPVAVELDNQIRVDPRTGPQEIPAYYIRVNSLSLIEINAVAMIGADAVYNARLVVDAEPIDRKATFAPVPVATLRIHVRSGQIHNCELVGEYSEVSEVTCDSLSGTIIDGVCHLNPNIDSIACGASQFMQGFDTSGERTCQNIPAPGPTPTPAPTPVPTPPPGSQTWTWQGLLYQTTCPALCDGVEWASCTGPGCGGARMMCYTASPWGVPGHAVGTNQTTQPAGFFCQFF